MTGQDVEEALAAALAEIAALREQNERLRGLLGLTEERSADPPVAWEPTLFSPPQVAPSVVDRRCVRVAMAKRPDGEVGVVACGRWWVGQLEATGPLL